MVTRKHRQVLHDKNVGRGGRYGRDENSISKVFIGSDMNENAKVYCRGCNVVFGVLYLILSITTDKLVWLSSATNDTTYSGNIKQIN